MHYLIMTDCKINTSGHENAKKAMLHGKAALDYNVTKLDTVEVAVDYNKCDEKWNMKFPVSWKHKF